MAVKNLIWTEDTCQDKSSQVIYAPALRSAWFSGKQYWIFVVGNCPTKAGGMGANKSKLYLCTKAAGKMWLTYYSGVAVNLAVIDFSVEYVALSPSRESRLTRITDPPGSLLALDRSKGHTGRTAGRLTARRPRPSRTRS